MSNSKKTIYNLAKELDLAPSTISKALNNLPGVSEQKRKMIVEYAQKVKYVPTSSARTLKAKNTYSIGIIYSEKLGIGLEHPFFSPILDSFKKYVENEGYELCFISSKLWNFGSSYKEFIENKKLSGVLIVAGNKDDEMLLDIIKDKDIKIVSTDYINENVMTVLSDNKEGTFEAIKEIHGSGLRKIGMLFGPSSQFSFNERKLAFIEATKKLNLIVKDYWVKETGNYLYSDGYAAMKKMIEETNGDLPEVMFAVSDMYALGIIAALKDSGYSVPKDISVVGFDDIEFVKYCNPSLSTVKQDTKLIGETAAKLLLDMIEKDYYEEEPRIHRIKTRYIKRGSTI